MSKCARMQTEKKGVRGPGGPSQGSLVSTGKYPGTGYWVLGNTRVRGTGYWELPGYGHNQPCSWEGNGACNNDPACHANASQNIN